MIPWDSKEIPWNCIENSTTLSYFSIHFACFCKTNKTPAYQGTQAGSKWHWSNTLSVRVISGIRKKSHEIVSRTRRVQTTSRYIRLRRTLEVTGINHFVSSSDFIGFERNLMKSYRELDNPVLLLDTIFYRKSLEVTGMNHFVSSSDFMGFERNPMKSYRELDKPKLLLDTFCLFL